MIMMNTKKMNIYIYVGYDNDANNCDNNDNNDDDYGDNSNTYEDGD